MTQLLLSWIFKGTLYLTVYRNTRGIMVPSEEQVRTDRYAVAFGQISPKLNRSDLCWLDHKCAKDPKGKFSWPILVSNHSLWMI